MSITTAAAAATAAVTTKYFNVSQLETTTLLPVTGLRRVNANQPTLSPVSTTRVDGPS